MKKLTAGIFSVLMGLVAVNAADAAVASKGYVTGQINAVNAEVAKKVDQSAYDTTIAALNEKDVSQDAEIGKRLVWSVDGPGLKLGENGVLTLDGIATAEGLSALEGAVEILNAEADQTGSVKQQIAAEAERTNTAIADAIAAEVERTDNALGLKEDLANKYQEADKPADFDTWDQATQQNWLKQHYASVNYVDAQIDQVVGTAANLDTSVQNLTSRMTTAEGRVSANEGEIAGLKEVDTALTGRVSANETAIEALQGKDTTIEGDIAGLKAADTTINNTIGTVDEGKTVVGMIAEAQEAAEDYTDAEIVKLDLQAISRVPAECSDAKNYCALTTDGIKFVWEVIERDPSEFEADGITLKSDGRTVIADVVEAQ